MVRPQKLSESDRVAFYGSLFAMAAVDGHVQQRELDLILDQVAIEPLSEDNNSRVRAFLVEPPSLDSCLARIATADRTLRLAFFLGLLQVALADSVVRSPEQDLLDRAQRDLTVPPRERSALEKFAAATTRLEHRGLDDEHARLTLERATTELTDAGVPPGVVYFGGTLVRLRAAGITSGLDSIGLGFGTVPGLDAALLLSVELGAGLRRALDPGLARLQAERAMRNLEAAITELIERVVELEDSAAEDQDSLRALRTLTRRLRTLQQAAHARKLELEGPPTRRAASSAP